MKFRFVVSGPTIFISKWIELDLISLINGLKVVNRIDK